MFRQPFRGDYPITLDYGEEWLPTYKAGQHKGIDYGCPEGTDILASEDGTVIKVGYEPHGYGFFIIVSHTDSIRTIYAHLKRVIVVSGEKVHKGEVIGISGSTGNSSGPHLHFEMQKSGTPFDPKTMLQSVFDPDPNNNTPSPVKPQFDTVVKGLCVVVCDYANVRCHCDMDRVIGMRKKGDIVSIGNEVTMYHGLPYRDYYDANFKCWLRIAEHDPYDQIIRNFDPKLDEINYDGTWYTTAESTGKTN